MFVQLTEYYIIVCQTDTILSITWQELKILQTLQNRLSWKSGKKALKPVLTVVDVSITAANLVC